MVSSVYALREGLARLAEEVSIVVFDISILNLKFQRVKFDLFKM